MDLTQVLTFISQNKWINAAIILFLFFVLARLILHLFKHTFARLASKTKTQLDDMIIKKIAAPVSLLFVLVGFHLAVLPLGMRKDVQDVVSNIVYTLIILLVTYVVIRLIDVVIANWSQNVAKKTKSKVDRQLVRLLSRFSRIFLAIIGLMVILSTWGVKIGPLLASLGIAGVAVAFALQSSLGNIFGGISLIADRSIKTGDMIKLDEQTWGYVIDVGLRSTKIRTFDNEVIIIPNGKLADSRIQNFVPPDPTVRVAVPFSVAYGSDIAKVKKTVLKVPPKVKGYMAEPKPWVWFLEMNDSSLDFKLYFWIDSYQKRFAAKDQANTLIYNYLKKAGITIPFPQQDVWIKEFKKNNPKK